jgi:hypothetical protein
VVDVTDGADVDVGLIALEFGFRHFELLLLNQWVSLAPKGEPSQDINFLQSLRSVGDRAGFPAKTRNRSCYAAALSPTTDSAMFGGTSS